MKKWILRLSILLVVAAAGWGGYRLMQRLETNEQTIATATVRQSDVVIRSYTRGELRAVRSVTLNAPNLFGTVQITRLAPIGALAREKDLVVEFDDSEVRSRLDEQQLELDQVDEQIKKAQADLAIRNNQDQVELLNARYAVRRAELEVKRNELLSSIDAKRNLLNLDEAKRRYQQLQVDIKSRLEQSEAELAVLRERRNRAALQVRRERMRLAQVKLLSPMEGLVAVRQSRPMGFFMRGMQLPDLREGDQVFPGMPVVDILDLSEMEVAAKVGELDRANLHEGQEAVLTLDAIPNKIFHGKIKSLSGTATANVWSGDPAKKFDVVFSIDMRELLTGLGAKPERIERILATAERNRKNPIATSQMSSFMSGGPDMLAGGMAGGMAGGFPGAGGAGMPGGGAQAMMAGQGGAPGGFGGFGQRGGAGEADESGEGGGRGERGGQRGGQRGMRFGGDLTPEQQTKLQAEMQKLMQGRNLREMSPEDQQKFRAEMAKVYQSVTGREMPARGQRPGGAAGGGGQRAAASGEGGPPMMGFARPGGAQGGESGAMPMMMPMDSGQQYSDAELAAAKLPPPPTEDSELNVLLRPGLLSDIEIVVEKVPNALHVPVQAIFEREGRPVVFVKTGGRFEERAVKPLKRSESVMVLAEGVKPGEVVALSNPMADKSGEKKQTGGGKGPALPTSGAAGAGGR